MLRKTHESSPYGTAILKGVDILKYLAEQPVATGVSRIARDLGMNRATVFKLLETLQLVGFVHKRESDSTYSLGPGLARLAHRAYEQLDITTIAQPSLERLNNQTKETVHLGIEDENMVVYVSKLESKQAVRMHSRVGNASPLYCTGIGKAIMSTWDDEKVHTYLRERELKQYTPNTITDANTLLKVLQDIRINGYAMDNSEHEMEVRCIAAPLYKDGILYGAFSVTAPTYRMDDGTVQRYIPLVKSCQTEILAKL
ncbi:IclR family transcriptional regulator [Alicyclobacillus dauci]|uniref:IclR family transcriptional regulator n=1 Tax=Alicyclobacillus dauci TaxID=1475485 RepID=A0ABY6Z584_9BACL|nr:IclR family transcriptional regulator [Alicyclobacillus dauci]WAH38029.1 IclR family transcriptional regulator [Alicyclobacillus dauci]